MSDRPTCVAVTGANGFVGRALVRSFASRSETIVRACYRSAPIAEAADVHPFIVGDLSLSPDLDEAVRGADLVVHTAARTHVMSDTEADPLSAYRLVNVRGTLNVARAAAGAGVRRFVYLSSIKVNGESTKVDHPFTEADTPAPIDAYGITKWEAERALWDLGRETGMEIVIVRPPLIYGPGVKGNLRRLVRLIERHVPIPLKSIRNKRSLVGLDNLVSAIQTASTHPGAAGQTYLVSDQEDLSTADMLVEIAAGLETPLRLWAMPPGVLRTAAWLTGRGDEIGRLIGSLRIDSSKLSRDLGWTPKLSVAVGLREMVAKAPDLMNADRMGRPQT